LGIDSNTALGKDIREFARLTPLWERIQQCIGKNESVAREELVITTDSKKKVPLGYSLSYIGGAKDRFSGCVMIFKDLSGIRELESKLKRAERLSYLGKMASWVAHEIRNPLTAIDGFAQLLENTKKKEKLQLFTAEIRKGTKRINYIIDDILAFARAKRKVAYVPINLKELIVSITESMSGTQIRITGSDSPIVEGDYESVRRLFVNLINNSIEAMKGEGTLDIAFGEERECVTVVIEDTGGGIPDEDIANIFEPFFTTKQHGTGLGLSIVKKIVDEHNGTIEMKSRHGEGTTVNLRLLKKQKEA
jgi:signal transduction histidine kinase